MVVVGHLLLDLEVAGRPQTLDDEVGLDRLGGLHDEPGKATTVIPWRSGRLALASSTRSSIANSPDGFAGLCMTATTTCAEQLQRLVDDVDMTVVERIETAGYQDLRHGSAKRYFGHRSKKVTQVRPYRFDG